MNIVPDFVDTSFLFHRARRVKPYDMGDPHWHEHYEIYYLVSGKREYAIENKIYNLDKGDLILIPPRTIHRSSKMFSDSHERLLINFHEDFLKKEDLALCDCFSSTHLTIPPFKRMYIESLFQKIESEYYLADDFTNRLLQNYLTELLVFINRLGNDHNIFTVKDVTGETIRDAAKYIQENFNQEIELQEMAQKAYMSEGYFSKKFKQFIGVGFVEYLNNVRISNAVQLLTSTNIPITTVAHQCGYNDSNYFTSVFKKIKGTTPAKYRKQYSIVHEK